MPILGFFGQPVTPQSASFFYEKCLLSRGHDIMHRSVLIIHDQQSFIAMIQNIIHEQQQFIAMLIFIHKISCMNNVDHEAMNT